MKEVTVSHGYVRENPDPHFTLSSQLIDSCGNDVMKSTISESICAQFGPGNEASWKNLEFQESRRGKH